MIPAPAEVVKNIKSVVPDMSITPDLKTQSSLFDFI